MTRATIVGAAFASVLVLLALALGYWALETDVDPATAKSSAVTPSITPPPTETHPASESHQGFLYGRITTADGATYEGRLRWGAARRRSGATTSTAPRTRTAGSPTSRPSS